MTAIESPVPGAQPSARPYKSVSEATRERETFKYEPFLFTDFRFNNTGVPIPSSELVSCSDSSLTGLAQLVAYQTNTERAFVSLFDSGHQYIVAEAMPGMSLTPNLPSDKCPSPLALCGIAIPRAHGTCEHVLYLRNADHSDVTTLPLSLVSNLAVDERFNQRPYCQFGQEGQFYAAVPIRSHRGINIGSFCVMSTKQPAGWGEQSVEQLRDVSRAVMSHLERNRSRNINASNERLNKGVRAFIAGEGSLAHWTSDADPAIFSATAYESLTQESTKAETPASEKEATITPPDSSKENNTPSHVAGESHADRQRRRRRRPGDAFYGPHPGGKMVTKNHEQPSKVFSRAANIMREAFEVDGCLFFDVGHTTLRRPSMPTPAHGEDTASQPSTTSSSDDPSHELPPEEPDTMCDIIGFSTTDKASVHVGVTHDGEMGMVPKRMLATLIRRYPAGKVFSFDNIGELQSSDSSDEGELEAAVRREEEVSGSAATRERRKRRTVKEGVLINQAFPNARSVAFIPVWDLKRERWFSAGFLYTCTPTRVFTVDEELSFLKAFASLAATEVLNQEVVLADQAKSDALGSLSHELRSPLHGVLLGTELLNDTDLDVFQANLTHTIETCCCTLLDTIDHLLDFSKVNSFATKRKRLPKDQKNVRTAEKTEQFGKKQLTVDVSLDDLVEEVADSMFAGYSFQHLAKGKHATLDGLMNASGHSRARERLAHIQTDSTGHSESTPGSRAEKISVFLSIDPSCSWDFHLQPGAIRRVVMNLLGNALKYTQRGNICLYLTQERTSPRRARSERIVKLVVQDSGQGMSNDFLQHKIFMPFSQEDELAPGTGLGLSLVKTIVTGMGGHISAKSELGVGSTFSVTIPLEPVAPDASDSVVSSKSKAFAEQAQALKGLRVRVFGFQDDDTGSRDGNGRAILEAICRDWLKVELHSAGDKSELTPDLVLWSYEALPQSTEELSHLAKMPHVILCQDPQVAQRLSKEYESAGYPGVLEFVSQPIGPRKLARSMQHAYKRWTGLTKASPPRHNPAPPGQTVNDLKHNFRIGMPSPLEELTSLALDSRLTPRNEHPPELRNPNDSPTVPDMEKPVSTRHYSDKDTFLLVDDNHVNLNVLAAYMAKLKLAYVTAVNGLEAVDTYKEKPSRFAAILMDVSMPVMDGLEATRQIRAFERDNKLSRVSVLALTGLASDRTHKEAFESGVDVFLTKPVRLQTLREQLGLAT
ncbi:hypothetical protein NLU13_5493 [Sarocladium strictum]|uniref:Nik-1 protein (Os-1p protein) n=1 Tax=Sarocladium strictum TaxID=5046 RepID=A0AA39GH04_SARSR|nr:hypothetical protein NLU13_5493 [Sarocladium strictum]